MATDKRPGTVELGSGIPQDLKDKLEKTKMSAEERAEACANSMWGMYNFTALRALMLSGGDWEKANEVCIEVEKVLVGFTAMEMYADHPRGDPAEVALDRPLRYGGITEEFRATRDARNAATADFMVLMNTYPKAHYRVVEWGPREATYHICGECPRKATLDVVHEVSSRKGIPSPLEGYNLFAICAAGAEGYEMAMPGVKGEGLKGMCKGDDHCEFRYYMET